jgi:hypothetical protein
MRSRASLLPRIVTFGDAGVLGSVAGTIEPRKIRRRSDADRRPLLSVGWIPAMSWIADLFRRARFQIAQEPVEALLISRRLLPLPEIADVALVSQLNGPRFAGRYHRVVDADRE